MWCVTAGCSLARVFHIVTCVVVLAALLVNPLAHISDGCHDHKPQSENMSVISHDDDDCSPTAKTQHSFLSIHPNVTPHKSSYWGVHISSYAIQHAAHIKSSWSGLVPAIRSPSIPPDSHSSVVPASRSLFQFFSIKFIYPAPTREIQRSVLYPAPQHEMWASCAAQPPHRGTWTTSLRAT